MFYSSNMFRSKVYLSRERNNNSHILHADNGRRVGGRRPVDCESARKFLANINCISFRAR